MVQTITCRVISGFGNNLYQIAAAHSIAKLQGKEFTIIAPKSDGDYQEIRDFGGHYTSMLDNLPKTFKEIFPNVPWVNYKDSDHELISSYIFDFSSISHKLEDIKEILKPDPSITEYISQKYPTSFDLGIHLRYNSGSDSFPPEAVNEGWLLDILTKETFQKDTFNVVVTSNRSLCANSLISEWSTTFPNTQFTLIESEPVFIDFFILANCSRVICSNSTFSFWAGILGKDKEKVYMTPEYKPAMCRTAIPNTWDTNRDVFYKTSLDVHD